MRTWFCSAALAAVVLLSASLSLASSVQGIRLLSQADPAQVPAGAGGDSCLPILSPDGRFVVFASTANNLLLTSNNLPIPSRAPATLNVYLRDRTAGTNALVSVNFSGVAGGNGDSLPADLSGDGRYVLFESSANDLVPGDTNNATDVFLRDLWSGQTILVSAATNGLPGNAGSRTPVMTPDGRFVAFVSEAVNLVPNDTNLLADVFVRDLQNETTIMASIGAMSVKRIGFSDCPEISDDGRYVAFFSTLTNMAAGATNLGEIYIRDLVANTTAWASDSGAALAGTNKVVCFNHQMTPDGRFVAYEVVGSAASYGTVARYDRVSGLTDRVGTNAALSGAPAQQVRTLDMTPDGRFIAFVAITNRTDGTTTGIALWDAQSGMITLVSANRENDAPPGSACEWPRLDATGRYVAFLSNATNMVTRVTRGEFHLYLRDTQSQELRMLDANADDAGPGISPASRPSLSADARFVAFESDDSLLVANDRNRASDIFLRDMQSNACELVSAHDPALATTTPNGRSTITPFALSADGRYAVFASDADNIVADDTNGCADIFLGDLASGATRLVSLATNGGCANGWSSEPAISANGRYVAFTSLANNLVPGDTNRQADVFVRDLEEGVTTLVSTNARAGFGNGASYCPRISQDGRLVLFRSKANFLVLPGLPLGENLFLRDLWARTNYALTTKAVAQMEPVMTPDGRFVAYATYVAANDALSLIYIWDSQLTSRIYTNLPTASGVTYCAALTPDGRRLVFAAGSTLQVGSLYLCDLPNGTNQLIEAPFPCRFPYDLKISDDGRYLACVKAIRELYLYDLQTGRRLRIAGFAAPGFDADSPTFGFDARFIAFRGSVTNTLAKIMLEKTAIFLYDQATGITLPLSAGGSSTGQSERGSLPVFSQDGTTLLFQAWPSGFWPSDFDLGSDLFVYKLPVLSIFTNPPPAMGVWLSWPWMPGQNARLEYTDNLASPNWCELTGAITNAGANAWLQDETPAAAQRFYRLTTY